MQRTQPFARVLFLCVTAVGVGCAPVDRPNESDEDAGPIDACANVAAIRSSCQELPTRFDVSTTLDKGCYHATTTPILGNDVTLTLSAGVTIVFGQGAGLDVDGGQSLVAAGTAAEPICLTGDASSRGAWSGIVLGRTDAADDALDHVTIEYAGSTEHDASAAAIKIVSDSRATRVALTNLTVRESEGFGLFVVGSTRATAFSGNVFTKNGLGPASVDSDVADMLDVTSRYTGNDVDEITVRANRISSSGTWRAIGVPFHLTKSLNVDAPWTIDPPNRIITPHDAWISVNGDAAALHAVGRVDAPIVFTGESTSRGSWIGLVFDGSNNAANRLEHVTVEYGGSTEHDFDGAAVKAIADSHGVTLSLAGTTIDESQGFGLYLAGSCVTPTFAANTFTKNTLGPASIGANAVPQLDTDSKYKGNDVDRIRVRDGRVSKTVTWKDLGVPYQLEENLHVDEVWTLAPGVTLLLPRDAWIDVGGDAAGFHVVGTPQKPITITGVEKTPGYWHSIVFDTTNNAANVFDYATIELGGSLSGSGERGMIQAQADSHGVTIGVTRSSITGSAQCGIWLGDTAHYNADIETSNTFGNNAGGDVCKHGP